MYSVMKLILSEGALNHQERAYVPKSLIFWP